MACNHKFQNELNLEGLDYEPTTLIVGTFNPEWPEGNNARWFYGRTHDAHGNQNNNFWDVLPRLYEEPSMINSTVQEWKRFCRRHQIAITDLISCIDDADEDNGEHVAFLENFSDKNIATCFRQHTTVDIVQILTDHPTIENIYLTRGTGETFWRRLWRPIVQYADQNDKYECRLLTPSGYAFYQQGRYNRQNPENQVNELSDFILKAWQDVWHF